MLWIFLTFMAGLLTSPSFAGECGEQTPCTLGARSYHVREPDGWDGRTPLPVLIHFHGWQRTGALPINHQRISGATRKRGVLLVAPNGRRKTWDFWTSETEDVAFAADLMTEIARRYPVADGQIFLSGYSYGAAMASRVACDRGNRVRALLSISGTIPQTETCAQAPTEARHVHGLTDTVLRFPFAADGDPGGAVALWRARLGCSQTRSPARSWSQVPFLTLERTEWRACEHGTKVTLDTHPGGHFIPHGWIARQLDELLGLPPSYP